MWVIRCNGKVMGRFREMRRGVEEMSRMIDSLGGLNDKWSLSEE